MDGWIEKQSLGFCAVGTLKMFKKLCENLSLKRVTGGCRCLKPASNPCPIIFSLMTSCYLVILTTATAGRRPATAFGLSAMLGSTSSSGCTSFVNQHRLTSHGKMNAGPGAGPFGPDSELSHIISGPLFIWHACDCRGEDKCHIFIFVLQESHAAIFV